jgi:hypothetical protein
MAGSPAVSRQPSGLFTHNLCAIIKIILLEEATMTDTANLALPCIEGSQAQKHVTHNEALRVLDTLVQLAVLDRDLTAPPGSPTEGQRWIVKTGATGAWASHVNAIAAWQDGAWQFSTPRTGWLAYVVDEGVLLVWNGSAWVDAIGALSPTALNNLTLLGVGTTADSTNPLSAKLNNTLFAAKTVAEGGDGHLRVKLSKESAAKTLSFLFQDNYSGRAEIGLTGADDLHVKVSADGTTWRDGIVITASTGAVTFPNTTIAGGRELLAANRTYYVRSDGSDGNTGLVNNSGGAFLTIQKAIDTVAALDLSIYTATIQVGAGTYTQALTLKKALGAAPVLKGDTTTPGNVIISPSSGDAISLAEFASWRVQGFKLTAAAGNGCVATGLCKCLIDGAMEFGACSGAHLAAGRGGFLNVTASYAISGGGASHMSIGSQGICMIEGAITATLSGTPAFSSSFATVAGTAFLRASGTTYSGSATGVRYIGSGNSAIETGGGGANFFPGSSAGSTSTGAQYT